MNQAGSNTILSVENTSYLNGVNINAGVRNAGSVKKGDKIVLIAINGGGSPSLYVDGDTKFNTMSPSDGIMKAELDIQLCGSSGDPVDGLVEANGKIVATALSDAEADLGPDSAAYYAMYLGVGKVVKLDDKDSLDCYGKLFYSHQAGDRAHLSNGYDYDFKAVDSIRTRLGLRYTHKINDKSSIYTGLAWQHEFDSKAKATIISGGTSFDAPSPSIKGDTGIFELGLGLTGSVGKQRGVGLNAQFQWMF